jgi:hypothetical protein
VYERIGNIYVNFLSGLLAGQYSLGLLVSHIGASGSLARLQTFRRSISRLGGHTLTGRFLQTRSVGLSDILCFRLLLVITVAQAERVVLFRLGIGSDRRQRLPFGRLGGSTWRWLALVPSIHGVDLIDRTGLRRCDVGLVKIGVGERTFT